MKNIYEILKSFELTVPEDKKEYFDKVLNENYKTISEVTKIQGKLEKAESERDTYKTKYDTDIKQRDADIRELQGKLKDAGTDTTKLADLQKELSALQDTYNTEKSKYEKQLSQQAYEFAIKEKVAELKFSSNSAKKAFIADALKEEMKMKDGQLQGFDDFLESYKKTDADAFLKEDTANSDEDEPPKPQLSGKSSCTETQPKGDVEKPSVKKKKKRRD